MGIFFTTFYQPVANILFFGLDILNTNNLFLGLLVLIVVVKLLLLKPSIASTRMQIKMSKVTPELTRIRENIKDKQKQVEQTLAIYKREKLNPFLSIFLLILQIPIYLAIFFFILDLSEGEVALTEVAYSFIQFSGEISHYALSMNLYEKGGIFLALIAAASQYGVIYFSQKNVKVDPRMQGFQKSLKIALPIMIGGTVLFMVSAVGVYWIVNNLLTLLQEILITNRIKAKAQDD